MKMGRPKKEYVMIPRKEFEEMVRQQAKVIVELERELAVKRAYLAGLEDALKDRSCDAGEVK